MTARSWLITAVVLTVLAGLCAVHKPKHNVATPVPILNRIPSIPGPQGHLFPSNPAGNDQMMKMVTPILIIQEEDEATLLGTQP